jgi:tetratricopeptide (TPR) repeat protein
MKTFFFLLLPTLTSALLLNTSLVTIPPFWPSFNFWPKRPRGNRARAIRSFKSQPVETQSYHSLMVNGARHYTAKNFALALSSYRRALTIRPNDMTALSGEAWSLYYLGQGEQAAKDFQAILKQDANDSWAREGIVLCQSISTMACA